MSIRPVEFNGIIQNSHEISQTKNHEDHRPAVNQSNITVEVNRQQDQQRHRVNDPNNASQQEYRYDREGNGSGYKGNQKKKQDDKNKAKQPPVDSVTIKRNSTSSFDIKI
ncbi:MAG: hypothetical protein HUJ71_03175 [Pseudobutyrivibrio sp.]|nr:hypothetical protein [Pseudobutyrivibrio sp.]